MTAEDARLLREARRADDAFRRADFWRAAPGSAGIASDYKEWNHFCVLGRDIDLLINFSFFAEGTVSIQATPRLTVLAHGLEGAWDGDVETFDQENVTITEGSTDVTFGDNRAWFAKGHYYVEVQLARREVTVSLALRPLAALLVPRSIELPNKQILRWILAPRLVAEGWARIGAHRYDIRGAPAYHDRNWGRFRWGEGYAWEWATILPDDARDPWCFVYSRIADRNQGVTLSQSLVVCRRDVPARRFYGRDLSIAHYGLLRRQRPLQIPRGAALAVQGGVVDIPRRMSVVAHGYGDQLEIELDLEDFAQIIAPNDGRLGLTALSESTGRAKISGRIGDEVLRCEARAQIEFNHACA
jgi:hypothetical protein